MSLADDVEIGTATKEDISGITKILENTLGQDFEFGENSFECETNYLFSRAIEDRNEQVYVARQGSASSLPTSVTLVATSSKNPKAFMNRRESSIFFWL